MIAIHTKYFGPTNTRGSRIKAYTCNYFNNNNKGFEVTIPYDYSLSGVDVHFKALKALVAKHNLDWNLDFMRYGDSADARGFSFCFDSSCVEVKSL
jgi:hypothetical protein